MTPPDTVQKPTPVPGPVNQGPAVRTTPATEGDVSQAPANRTAASKIQKLYRTNRLKALREVLDGPPSYCTIPSECLHSYFLRVFGGMPRNDAQRPECLGPLPHVTTTDNLEADFTPKEVAARLSRTKNTAPGKDGIPYSLLRKRDPGYQLLLVRETSF
uniref:Uncharacterized protein n=1 Tax=Chelonoidis abingdonii TaxID=106734 RepID=A0A8C0IJG5_CHEAB